MEDEIFISGYCRQIDRSRMVTVMTVDGALDEVDCCYGSCLYQPGCPIAQEISEKIKA